LPLGGLYVEKCREHVDVVLVDAADDDVAGGFTVDAFAPQAGAAHHVIAGHEVVLEEGQRLLRVCRPDGQQHEHAEHEDGNTLEPWHGLTSGSYLFGFANYHRFTRQKRREWVSRTCGSTDLQDV